MPCLNIAKWNSHFAFRYSNTQTEIRIIIMASTSKLLLCVYKRNECVGIFNFQVLELTFRMDFIAAHHTAQFAERSIYCDLPPVARSNGSVSVTLLFLSFWFFSSFLAWNGSHILTLLLRNWADFQSIFNHRISTHFDENFTNSITPRCFSIYSILCYASDVNK